MHLFGTKDEAVHEQINYVLNEDEIIGKGPNGTLSLYSMELNDWIKVRNI